MCGIAGFTKSGAVDARSMIQKQLELLAHRGPDSFGMIDNASATIGQTRLSVIDLITGDPPISNEDGSVGVAFNGEIYNFRELRERLLARGHSFATQGDTEVIAHLAEDLDPVSLARSLDGMFACAVWDERSRRLTLIRDRLGKKPLYYWSDGTDFVFGSEIKALLAHPAVPRVLDPMAIDSYLTFGYVPTPRTFFDGVRSLPPGHVLTIDGSAEVEPVAYWEPRVAGRDHLDISFDEAAGELRRLLEAAVERRLVADVPLGAFLSGGIDSSAIVASMAFGGARAIKTFTIGFEDDQGFDERSFARLVAERFKTDHRAEVVEPKAIDLIDRLVWHHDQPFGDSSAIPTFLLAEITREDVTVALSGDGGDELFAGYERFAAGLAAERYAGLPRPARAGARRLVGALSASSLKGRAGSAQRFAERAEMGLPDAFRSWLSYVPEDRRRALRPGASDWANVDYRRVWDASAGAATLDRLLYLNLQTYLVDDLLVKADRMSMAHGLEVRSPFLDTALVEFAFALPPHFKIKGLTLKRILKKAFEDILPPEILRRKKRGFGVPLDRWFRTDLASYVRSSLGPGARLRQHIDGPALDDLLGEHYTEVKDHGHALWALLTLEMFLRREGW